jgi:predicted Zn-dependent protease
MTQSTSPNDRLIADARQAIEQGRPADARPLLERAARQDAHDPRPWLLLAGIAATPRERRAYLAQARRLDANAAVRPPGRRACAAPRAAAPPAAPPAKRPVANSFAGAWRSAGCC